MSFSTPSFQHTVLLEDLDTFRAFWTAVCCPFAPVLIFLWWKRSVVTALFGCQRPSWHYSEVLCLPTTHPRSGVLWVRSLHLRGSPACRETSGAVLCCPCFSLGFCSPVLSNLNRKCFYFFSKNNDDYDWLPFSCWFFPPLSLILAICIANLIQWLTGFV